MDSDAFIFYRDCIRNNNRRNLVKLDLSHFRIMSTLDETWNYGDFHREAVYEDSSGDQIPLKDKNGLAVRYLDILMYRFENHQQFFHVRKDEDFRTVLFHIPTGTIEKLTPDIAGTLERL